jgi:hypothetical protein
MESILRCTPRSVRRIEKVAWLKPQKIPENFENSYESKLFEETPGIGVFLAE